MIESLKDYHGVLLFTEFYDVTFLVGPEEVPISGSKFLLASQSDYFRALFYGGFKEARESEIKVDRSPRVFRLFLDFLHSGFLEIGPADWEALAELYQLSQEYCLLELRDTIKSELISSIRDDNVLDYLLFLDVDVFDQLHEVCFEYIFKQGEDILRNPKVQELSANQMALIVGEDELDFNECDRFRLSQRWFEHNTDCSTDDRLTLLKCINIHWLSAKQINEIVAPTGLFEEDHLDQVLAAKHFHERGAEYFRFKDENVATARHGFQTQLGSLLELDWVEGLRIDNQSVLIFDLGFDYVFNFIGFEIIYPPDSYTIEVSSDQIYTEWRQIKVVTNQSKHQSITFPEVIAKYIRLTAKRRRLTVKSVEVSLKTPKGQNTEASLDYLGLSVLQVTN